jgi:hypothetical protein
MVTLALHWNLVRAMYVTMRGASVHALAEKKNGTVRVAGA